MSKDLKGGPSGGRLNQSNVRKMKYGGRSEPEFGSEPYTKPTREMGLPGPGPRGPRQRGVQIGNQCWASENLKATRYNDGSFIYATDDNDEWANLFDQYGGSGTGAYAVYDNQKSNADIYGYLYNWYAIEGPSGICPTGWHVPTDDEWQTLIDHLGGNSEAGGKLKEVGNNHWAGNNLGATNESGFTGLPGGQRAGASGQYGSISYFGHFWTSSINPAGEYYMAWDRRLNYNWGGIWRNYSSKRNGKSVRCISDSPTCN